MADQSKNKADRKRAYDRWYGHTHRETINAVRRARTRTEPQKEKDRARRIRYRERHPEEIRRRDALYRTKNRPARRVYDKRRRARKAGATVGDCKPLRAIYRRARETQKVDCYLCGKRIPLGDRHVDHIVPLAVGGEHSSRNLMILCSRCNQVKSVKSPQDLGLLC